VTESEAKEMVELEDEVGEEAGLVKSPTDLTRTGPVTKLAEGVEKSVTLQQLVQMIFPPKAKRRRLWTTNAPEAQNPAVAQLGQIRN
jgi:hypothetical protein